VSPTLQLGPLVLSVPLLLGAAAFLLAGFVGRRLGKADGAQVDAQLLRMLLLGVLAARVAFVVQFRDAYLKWPLGILDIRDGGWNMAVGLGAALAYGAFVLARRAVLRKPLVVALAAGAGLWLAGTLILSVNAPRDVRLPQLTLLSMEGQTVALSTFAGRPTVVNLWATWCPPCQREMPVLRAAQLARPDVHFVFLNQRESAQQVASFLQKRGLVLQNVLLDGRGEAGTALGQRALPTTLFFDAGGRLVDTRVGELSEASLTERLASISTP
jgi:thiol-disulfide isomerase/thioredoxin